MEAKLGLGGMWSVLGQALTPTATPLAPGQGGRSDLGIPLLQRKLGERSPAARVSHNRWPAAGRGSRPLSFQPGCPSPRLSCAEDCSVDATAGLPTNTTQQNVTKPLGFLGISEYALMRG